MAADSRIRRAFKRVLSATLSPRHYAYIQAGTMAWDIRRGTFHEPELSLLPLAIRNGETTIDIGANYGAYTHHLSRAVGVDGRVYAFEPIPFTHQSLRLVLRLLRVKNAAIIPKGCSDKNARVHFTVPLQGSGAISAGLAHIRSRNDRGEPAGENESQEVVCDVVALDDYLPPLANVSFIKCDIEGAELLAFKGGEALISRHHPTVLSEVTDEYLERFGLEVEDLTGFFFDRGYGLFAYDPASCHLLEIGSDAVKDGNILFVHPDRRHRLEGVIRCASPSI